MLVVLVGAVVGLRAMRRRSRVLERLRAMREAYRREQDSAQ